MFAPNCGGLKPQIIGSASLPQPLKTLLVFFSWSICGWSWQVGQWIWKVTGCCLTEFLGAGASLQGSWRKGSGCKGQTSRSLRTPGFSYCWPLFCLHQVIIRGHPPSEAAFVIAARELGFEFYERTQSSILLHELDPLSGWKVQRLVSCT